MGTLSGCLRRCGRCDGVVHSYHIILLIRTTHGSCPIWITFAGLLVYVLVMVFATLLPLSV